VDVDAAVALWPAVDAFLRQPLDEVLDAQESWQQLQALTQGLVQAGARP
jgi:flagellar biosynthesis/type III secretory pathway ATPase